MNSVGLLAFRPDLVAVDITGGELGWGEVGLEEWEGMEGVWEQQGL